MKEHAEPFLRVYWIEWFRYRFAKGHTHTKMRRTGRNGRKMRETDGGGGGGITRTLAPFEELKVGAENCKKKSNSN